MVVISQTEMMDKLRASTASYKREADQIVRSQGIGGADASIVEGVNPFKNNITFAII